MFKLAGRRDTVQACNICNQKRSRISLLFQRLRYVQDKARHNKFDWQHALNSWLRLRAAALSDMEFFYERYEQTLTDEYLEACMYELAKVGGPNL